MDDLISIIVPVYNVEKYLIKCLESIRNQTFHNFEVILVNDGSSDSCGEICDNYIKIDSSFQVIHKENEGLSAARNTGLEVARGKYICFIDSDDWVREQLLEQLMHLLVSYGADVSQCDFFSDERNFLYDKEEIRLYTRDEYMIGLLENKIPSYFCGKLFKRELFDNQRFPQGKTYEDLLFMPQFILNTTKIVVTNQKYYFYYLRSDSITKDPRYRINNQIAIAEAFRSRYYLAYNDYKETDYTVFKRAVEASICAFTLLKNLKKSDSQLEELEANYQFIAKHYSKIKANRDISIWFRLGAFLMLHYPLFFSKTARAMMEVKYRFQKIHS